MIIDLALALTDPRTVGALVGLAVGGPELADRLVAICERESRCSIVGTHEIDAWRSSAAWSDAVAAGRLDPERCRWHRFDSGPWSTSGPWGAMRAYSLPYLGCLPAWALDVPPIGAVAAALRSTSPRCLRIRRCRSWAVP